MSETEAWRLARDIFYELIETEPASRGEALDRLCAGEPELRAKVETLLDGAGKPSRIDNRVWD